MQIIGHDDPVIAAAELRGLPGFEIDRPHLASVSRERLQLRKIAVHCDHGKAHLEQQPGVTAAASGEVEHMAAGPDQRGEAPNPSRWTLLTVR
jgi:hypothetical protein